MSRCFPYPPPGYVRNGIRDEALIESIKLQREGEKAKKERKIDKKRGKKEKDKKEKEKSHQGNREVESKQHRHKKRHRDEKNRENEKGRDLQHKTGNKKEQPENSGLTEEHGHPVGSQNSSDSTLNNQKRQKLSLSPDGGHNSGSIIRIRLPPQRQKDPGVLPNKEQSYITFGRIDDPSIQMTHEPALRPGRERQENPCSTSTKVWPDVTLKHMDEKRSTGASETCARKEETAQAASLCGICPPDLASKVRNVIENWVPPTVHNEVTDVGDEDWLFESKQNQKCGGFRRCEEDILGCSSHANTATWPQVCLLPEVDIYALPFTVPY